MNSACPKSSRQALLNLLSKKAATNKKVKKDFGSN